MTGSGMYIDMKDFDRKFNALVKNAIPKESEKGAFDAMNELLRDAIVHPPQAPKDIGDLWGSRIVEKAQRAGKVTSVEGLSLIHI